VNPGRFILLAPIEPARSGNGLAMRTELFLRFAPRSADALTVVVPVAGSARPDSDPPPELVMVPPDPVAARAGVTKLVGERIWRERLAEAEPLPPLARAASPGLADAVVRACQGRERVGLHVMRSYLAPLGMAVAERLEAARVTLDLDDDDATFAASSGDFVGAAAYDRLLAVFGPLFDGLSAASAHEAEAMSRRYGLAIEHVANAVDLPDSSERQANAGARNEISLLLVGNLTYAPNVEAARVLVEATLPRVRRRLDRPIRVTLVGHHHRDLRRLAGPHVTLSGFISDLGPLYAAADVVVVGLKWGGGTRIKLLEAFAYGVPVVASQAAAAGLDVTGGRHLLFAENPDEAAAAIAMIVTTPTLAARLSAEGKRLVRERYSSDLVGTEIREFFAGAEERARSRAQVSVSP
jgi:glycosyltransferase involved in cell wall biosynthesis